MNNNQLSHYIGEAPAATRKLFDDVRVAFEDANLGSINKSLADLYLTGSKPANYDLYMDRLNAVDLVAEQGGYHRRTAETVVKEGFYDPWLMLLACCRYFVGSEIPADFDTFVIQPLDEHLLVHADADLKKKSELAKARKAIETITDPLLKARHELAKFESWMLAGTREESIGYQINNLLGSLERIR